MASLSSANIALFFACMPEQLQDRAIELGPRTGLGLAALLCSFPDPRHGREKPSAPFVGRIPVRPDEGRGEFATGGRL